MFESSVIAYVDFAASRWPFGHQSQKDQRDHLSRKLIEELSEVLRLFNRNEFKNGQHNALEFLEELSDCLFYYAMLFRVRELDHLVVYQSFRFREDQIIGADPIRALISANSLASEYYLDADNFRRTENILRKSFFNFVQLIAILGTSVDALERVSYLKLSNADIKGWAADPRKPLANSNERGWTLNDFQKTR